MRSKRGGYIGHGEKELSEHSDSTRYTRVEDEAVSGVD